MRASPSSARLQLDQLFAADEILESVALANQVRVAPIHQDLGTARPAVVVRRHHESVCARAHYREQVSGLRLGHLALARKKVAALAYRPDHVRSDGLGV